MEGGEVTHGFSHTRYNIAYFLTYTHTYLPTHTHAPIFTHPHTWDRAHTLAGGSILRDTPVYARKYTHTASGAHAPSQSYLHTRTHTSGTTYESALSSRTICTLVHNLIFIRKGGRSAGWAEEGRTHAYLFAHTHAIGIQLRDFLD